MPFRVGIGFDVHRFTHEPERQHYVHVCGIKIPHTRGVIAHSDGDVGLHALTDALLGCIGEGGIGEHFSDRDPKWRDMPSTHFLTYAQQKATLMSYAILNFDMTIVCEYPKIAPHVPHMKEFLVQVLGIAQSCMNIKAVTTERLGFLGREEGIAAHAVVLCKKV
ncbi:2-C-methyl-D-erythritol 2,4-cyclodiphosphate synthase [Anaplasma platys]|uniref:2-C-methyl-D-erythritol 2,4-cyclodiphosphate synthase n=1 Tax=Anaplasma platys TaxID=949 RepID=UPI00145D6184|nr:2-C-methyl-D-erythritol 2,4-cyclodiphosphate synthase [Anaplasma platys]